MGGIIKVIGRYKVYLDRTRAYIGYVQFVAILLVFVEAYKETPFGRWFYGHSAITIPAFIVLFIVLSLVVGYVDKRVVRSHEQDEMNQTNPWVREMNDRLERIERKIDET